MTCFKKKDEVFKKFPNACGITYNKLDEGYDKDGMDHDDWRYVDKET